METTTEAQDAELEALRQQQSLLRKSIKPAAIVEAQNLDDFPPDAPITVGSRWVWTAREDKPIVEVLAVGGTDPDDRVSIKVPFADFPQNWPVRDFGPGKRFEPAGEATEQLEDDPKRETIGSRWVNLVSVDCFDPGITFVLYCDLGGDDGYLLRHEDDPDGVLTVTVTHDDLNDTSKWELEAEALERQAFEERALARITPEACAVGPEAKKRGRKAKNVLHSSASNEWYTPVRYADAAREVMGAIDMDPASNDLANKTIQAATYFTAETDGFDKPWTGRVFLNPPYGKQDGESNQARWSKRLIEQYRAGVTTEAILLINATTERTWFKALWDFPICFTDHRISFYGPEGEGSQPTHGNAFVYLGPNTERFREVFEQFGAVVLPPSTLLVRIDVQDQPETVEAIAERLRALDAERAELREKAEGIAQAIRDRRSAEDALLAQLGLTA